MRLTVRETKPSEAAHQGVPTSLASILPFHSGYGAAVFWMNPKGGIGNLLCCLLPPLPGKPRPYDSRLPPELDEDLDRDQDADDAESCPFQSSRLQVISFRQIIGMAYLWLSECEHIRLGAGLEEGNL
jgi:hypothetical protein